MTDEELKQKIGNSIQFYRQKAGLTQSALAGMLNYSDKSISKWECGDGIPDVIVLKKMADIFNITLNDFLYDSPKNYTPEKQKKHIMIPVLSVFLCWFVMSIIFILLQIISSYVDLPILVPWLVFVWAVPMSAVILLVFSKIWWTRLTNAIMVSLLDWSLIVSLHLTFTFAYPIAKIHLIYLAAAIFQIIIVLWFIMKGKRKAKIK